MANIRVAHVHMNKLKLCDSVAISKQAESSYSLKIVESTV